MIITFAWTSAPLLAGRKTVTRREWSDNYAARFKKNMMVDAYDRQPRFKGKKIAVIQLTHDPVLMANEDMPDSDYEAEGFAYLEGNRHLVPKAFHMMPGETMLDRFNLWRYGSFGFMWVIRFKLVRIEQ